LKIRQFIFAIHVSICSQNNINTMMKNIAQFAKFVIVNHNFLLNQLAVTFITLYVFSYLTMLILFLLRSS